MSRRGLLHILGMPLLPEERMTTHATTTRSEKVGSLGNSELTVRVTRQVKPGRPATIELVVTDTVAIVVVMEARLGANRKVIARPGSLLDSEALLRCATLLGTFEKEAYDTIERMVNWRSKHIDIMVYQQHPTKIRFRYDPHHPHSPMRLTGEFLSRGRVCNAGVAVRLTHDRLVLTANGEANLLDIGPWLNIIAENEAHIVAKLNAAMGPEDGGGT